MSRGDPYDRIACGPVWTAGALSGGVPLRRAQYGGTEHRHRPGERRPEGVEPGGKLPDVYASLGPGPHVESLAPSGIRLGRSTAPCPAVPRHRAELAYGPGPPGAPATPSVHGGMERALRKTGSLHEPWLGVHLSGNRARSLHGRIGSLLVPSYVSPEGGNLRSLPRPAQAGQPHRALKVARYCACNLLDTKRITSRWVP